MFILFFFEYKPKFQTKVARLLIFFSWFFSFLFSLILILIHSTLATKKKSFILKLSIFWLQTKSSSSLFKMNKIDRFSFRRKTEIPKNTLKKFCFCLIHSDSNQYIDLYWKSYRKFRQIRYIGWCITNDNACPYTRCFCIDYSDK